MSSRTFVVHEQPYGSVYLTDCVYTQEETEYVDYNHGRRIRTRTVGVIRGVLAQDEVKCSLFGGVPVTSSVRAKKGTPRTVWYVTPAEWERGEKVTVAM
ncbi:MAG: hypothetical protein ACYSWO_26165 [Planctomycetota bacterium]|jgi:hypothetical protein